MDTLTGKVALVTGASRGIGAGVAQALAQKGVAVAVNYHSHAEAAAQVCSEIAAAQGRAFPVQADVSQANAVREMIEKIDGELGPVDILVNNAGIARA